MQRDTNEEQASLDFFSFCSALPQKSFPEIHEPWWHPKEDVISIFQAPENVIVKFNAHMDALSNRLKFSCIVNCMKEKL